MRRLNTTLGCTQQEDCTPGTIRTTRSSEPTSTSSLLASSGCWSISIGCERSSPTLCLDSSVRDHLVSNSPDPFAVCRALLTICAAYFLLQSIIIYTLGIRLCTDNMGENLANYTNASGIAFISTLLVTIVAGEVFYWLIEWPTKAFARFVFDWIRE